jgi:hypothetical protein
VREHTSTSFSIDEDAVGCWCNHEEDRHIVKWKTNNGESKDRPVGAVYPFVGCLDCLKDQIATRVLQHNHLTATLESLAKTNAAAASALEASRVVDELIERHKQGADVKELATIVERHREALEQTELLQLLLMLPDKGQA